jgi:hypothetical protein
MNHRRGPSLVTVVSFTNPFEKHGTANRQKRGHKTATQTLDLMA